MFRDKLASLLISVKRLQITINALKNQDSVSMAPPVKEPGHRRDVTALIVWKETDVTSVKKGSKVKNVTSVWRGSREMVARIVLHVSRVMNAKNVQTTTTEMIVVKIFKCFYFARNCLLTGL